MMFYHRNLYLFSIIVYFGPNDTARIHEIQGAQNKVELSVESDVSAAMPELGNTSQIPDDPC